MTVNVIDALSVALTDELFPPERQLLTGLNDIYELELAFYENRLLTDKELLRNGAYFARVIKGLMNVMGLKPQERVLDPMMGSGTVLVEAALMGIRSVGVDASPFCKFMAQTKIDGLTVPLTRVRKALGNYEEVFRYFQNRVGRASAGVKARRSAKSRDFMSVMEPAAEYVTRGDREKLTSKQQETARVYNFLLLAYLDSAGYSERSTRRSPLEQFKAILERYLFVAEKIQNVLKGLESEVARAEALEGDARALPLEDSSVDGIIFSPPYSFAIDYLNNDSFHLNFLGIEPEDLRQNMIGLRGVKLADKFEHYKEDMDKVLSECARVLSPSRICTIVVGTNNNQLGKVLGLPPNEVPGIHEILSEMASLHGFALVKQMSRPIIGISNTMRREYILMLRLG